MRLAPVYGDVASTFFSHGIITITSQPAPVPTPLHSTHYGDWCWGFSLAACNAPVTNRPGTSISNHSHGFIPIAATTPAATKREPLAETSIQT